MNFLAIILCLILGQSAFAAGRAVVMTSPEDSAALAAYLAKYANPGSATESPIEIPVDNIPDDTAPAIVASPDVVAPIPMPVPCSTEGQKNCTPLRRPRITTPNEPDPEPEPTKEPDPKPVIEPTSTKPRFAQCKDGKAVKDYAAVVEMIEGVLGFRPDGHRLAESDSSYGDKKNGPGQIRMFNNNGSAQLWLGKKDCKPGQLLTGFCSYTRNPYFCQEGNKTVKVFSGPGDGEIYEITLTRKSATKFFMQTVGHSDKDSNFYLESAR